MVPKSAPWVVVACVDVGCVDAVVPKRAPWVVVACVDVGCVDSAVLPSEVVACTEPNSPRWEVVGCVVLDTAVVNSPPGLVTLVEEEALPSENNFVAPPKENTEVGAAVEVLTGILVNKVEDVTVLLV